MWLRRRRGLSSCIGVMVKTGVGHAGHVMCIFVNGSGERNMFVNGSGERNMFVNGSGERNMHC